MPHGRTRSMKPEGNGHHVDPGLPENSGIPCLAFMNHGSRLQAKKNWEFGCSCCHLKQRDMFWMFSSWVMIRQGLGIAAIRSASMICSRNSNASDWKPGYKAAAVHLVPVASCSGLGGGMAGLMKSPMRSGWNCSACQNSPVRHCRHGSLAYWQDVSKYMALMKCLALMIGEAFFSLSWSILRSNWVQEDGTQRQPRSTCGDYLPGCRWHGAPTEPGSTGPATPGVEHASRTQQLIVHLVSAGYNFVYDAAERWGHEAGLCLVVALQSTTWFLANLEYLSTSTVEQIYHTWSIWDMLALKLSSRFCVPVAFFYSSLMFNSQISLHHPNIALVPKCRSMYLVLPNLCPHNWELGLISPSDFESNIGKHIELSLMDSSRLCMKNMISTNNLSPVTPCFGRAAHFSGSMRVDGLAFL